MWVWIDDDGALWSDANTDSIIPYVPEVDNVPLDIQFKLYDEYGVKIASAIHHSIDNVVKDLKIY